MTKGDMRIWDAVDAELEKRKAEEQEGTMAFVEPSGTHVDGPYIWREMSERLFGKKSFEDSDTYKDIDLMLEKANLIVPSEPIGSTDLHLPNRPAQDIEIHNVNRAIGEMLKEDADEVLQHLYDAHNFGEISARTFLGEVEELEGAENFTTAPTLTQGSVENVQLFDRALSPKEVGELFEKERGAAAPCQVTEGEDFDPNNPDHHTPYPEPTPSYDGVLEEGHIHRNTPIVPVKVPAGLTIDEDYYLPKTDPDV